MEERENSLRSDWTSLHLTTTTIIWPEIEMRIRRTHVHMAARVNAFSIDIHRHAQRALDDFDSRIKIRKKEKWNISEWKSVCPYIVWIIDFSSPLCHWLVWILFLDPTSDHIQQQQSTEWDRHSLRRHFWFTTVDFEWVRWMDDYWFRLNCPLKQWEIDMK